MKEDILEQLVDDYFLRKLSTFTKHNIKFKPDMKDISHLDKKTKSRYSVSSDIDVIAIHLDQYREKRVSVVSCKSWQSGFDIDFFYEHLIDKDKRNVRVGANEAWKKFRELVEEKWAKAFRDTIYKETKSYDFTYYIAVTKFRQQNKIEDFKNCKLFLNNLSDNGKHNVKINFLTLEEILNEIYGEHSSTTLEATEIGRFIQLIKAAKIRIEK